MKMAEQQKAAYKLYRKECRVSNVEPVRADFLAGVFPSRYQPELQPKTMAATAGR